MKISPEDLRRYDRPGPRYTSYPTALQFTPEFTAADYEQRLELERERDLPLSVYMHLPFCKERCLYCACNVTVSPRPERVSQPYLSRLVREMGLVAAHLGRRRKVAQLHLGGGTPTYHTAYELEGLMEYFLSHFDLTPDAELSVEVDPRVTSRDQLEVLATYGFRRISLGVQDLEPAVQQAIGRIQSIEQTKFIVDTARELGFTSVNMDLIYGLPLQTEDSFIRTLDAAVALGADRLAIYGFAYVPWAQHHQKALDPTTFPDASERLSLLATARERLLGQDWEAIGIDHFARPTDELATAQAMGTLHRNFMGYTVQRTETMIGLGLSSIGYAGGAWVQNHRKLSDYMNAIDAGQLPVERGHAVSQEDRIRAHLIEEIMCNGRVERDRVEERFDVDFPRHYARELDRLQREYPELAMINGEGIELTPLGRVFARNVAMVFDAWLPEQPAAADSPSQYSRTV